MPDIALKPDDWKKFNQGLQSDAAPEVTSSYSPAVEGGINLAKGLGKGAAKGVAGMIPESVEGKGWKDWSSSPGDPNSMAENAGEWVGDAGANIAPFFLTPGLGIASKTEAGLNALARARPLAASLGNKVFGPAGYGASALKTMQTVGKYGPKIGKYLEGTFKGSLAGAGEAAAHNEEAKTPEQFSDATKRGAVEGGVTAAEFTAGRLAYEALPAGIKHLIQAGALATTAAGAGLAVWDRLGHHHYIPYHLLSTLAAPFVGVAAGATKLPPGVIGAGAERAAQKAGYEPGGSAPSASEPQDEIISR
jgi:hypothetical protein